MSYNMPSPSKRMKNHSEKTKADQPKDYTLSSKGIAENGRRRDN
jgi:hypothetical protein